MSDYAQLDALDALVPQDALTEFSSLKAQNEASILAQEGLVRMESIPIDILEPNPFQPRKGLGLDAPEVHEMAKSIDTEGLDYEIRVRPDPGHPGRFQVGDGETRLWAFRFLYETYRETDPERSGRYAIIPAKVLPYSDTEMALLAFRTGIQRNAYTDLGLCQQMNQLLASDASLTQERIAEAVGKSIDWVKRKMRAQDNIPERVLVAYEQNGITEGHVLELKRLRRHESLCNQMLRVTLQEGLSRNVVRERVGLALKALDTQAFAEELRLELAKEAIEGALTPQELLAEQEDVGEKNETAWAHARNFWQRLSPKKREAIFQQLWEAQDPATRRETLKVLKDLAK